MQKVTKEKFEEDYINNSDITKEEYDSTNITLPCECKHKNCRGWASVSRTLVTVRAHLECNTSHNEYEIMKILSHLTDLET